MKWFAVWQAMLQLEEDLDCSVWYERVASHSNVADKPSRDPEWRMHGATCVTLDLHEFLQDSLGLKAVTSDSGGGGAM